MVGKRGGEKRGGQGEGRREGIDMAPIGQYPKRDSASNENSHSAGKTKEVTNASRQETRRRPLMRSQKEVPSV